MWTLNLPSAQDMKLVNLNSNSTQLDCQSLDFLDCSPEGSWSKALDLRCNDEEYDKLKSDNLIDSHCSGDPYEQLCTTLKVFLDLHF